MASNYITYQTYKNICDFYDINDEQVQPSVYENKEKMRFYISINNYNTGLNIVILGHQKKKYNKTDTVTYLTQADKKARIQVVIYADNAYNALISAIFSTKKYFGTWIAPLRAFVMPPTHVLNVSTEALRYKNKVEYEAEEISNINDTSKTLIQVSQTTDAHILLMNQNILNAFWLDIKNYGELIKQPSLPSIISGSGHVYTNLLLYQVMNEKLIKNRTSWLEYKEEEMKSNIFDDKVKIKIKKLKEEILKPNNIIVEKSHIINMHTVYEIV